MRRRDVGLGTLPGVFAPISDSWLLAAALRRESPPAGSTVLDLCTGTGVLAITAARLGAQVTAVDVSRRAILTVKVNARRHGVRLRAVRGRLFEPVADERFDLVVCNPPYVPAPEDDVPGRGRRRAWAAGRDGRLVLDRVCDEARSHLVSGGALLLVHSGLTGEETTVDRLLGAGFADAEVVDRQRGPLGPLMREQQQLGTIPSDVDHEDVVVIRARTGGRTPTRDPE
jgi:release factor glutamine methyltransferase